MLRITVELVPKGMEQWKETIAHAEIVNDGSGSFETGNYDIYIHTKDKFSKHVRVENHKRTVGTVWDLLAKALSAA